MKSLFVLLSQGIVLCLVSQKSLTQESQSHVVGEVFPGSLSLGGKGPYHEISFMKSLSALNFYPVILLGKFIYQSVFKNLKYMFI